MTDYQETTEPKTESVSPIAEGRPDTPRGLAAMQGKDASSEQGPPLKERGEVPPQLPSAKDDFVQGDATEKEKLAAGFTKLESTQAGQPAADAIREHGTTLGFGQTQEEAVAQFEPDANAITINESQKDASPEVLASHLAHEGTHVQWDQPSSIDQEYHAYKAQAGVWNETKGKQTDEQCDTVSEIMEDEAEARAVIRRLYPELPEN